MLPLSFPFSLASGPDALAPDISFVWTASNCWFASCIWHNESVLCYVSNRLLDNFESLWAYIVHGLKHTMRQLNINFTHTSLEECLEIYKHITTHLRAKVHGKLVISGRWFV
jgi:hypothetical protein